MNYGCIGEKLSHSFSKDIHAQLADYSYELTELTPDAIGKFLTARDFRAINVTIPYKETVIPYLDHIDPTAAAIGAVNTVVNRDGKLYGYNTDFAGMEKLCRRVGITLTGKKVLILGSGGTSKTAYALAAVHKARQIHRVSRRAQEGCITYDEALTCHTDAEVIINATPCGMFPQPNAQPIDPAAFPHLSGVVDAIYNPLRSHLVQQAQARGIKASGGLYMLVAQAAVAVEHFTGKAVDDATIERVYRTVRNNKRNCVLIGMPSCGKSTLGKRLAARLGMDFIDTDSLIRTRIGKSIPAIFDEIGEAGFRDIEAAVIRDLENTQNSVIATGGGAILREENRIALRSNGFLLFLDRPLEALVSTADRPLSGTADKLQQRYTERYGIYCATADDTVSCVQNIEANLRQIEKRFLK